MKLIKWLKLSWIAIVVGIFLVPTVSLGGTYVSSLIQGKSPQEAVSILADQFDSLIGRVNKLEQFQSQQETINKLQNQLNEQQAATNSGSQQSIASLNSTIASLNATIALQRSTINSLQGTQDLQAKQIECDQLKRTTLQFGDVSLINSDVVKWYENIQKDLDNWKTLRSPDELAQAKALYDNYLAKCQK